MTTERKDYVYILACSLLVGILALIYAPHIPVVSDFADYDFIAQQLLATHTYVSVSIDNIIYPPLYPIFLACIFALFGHTFTYVYLIQFLLLGLIAIGTYLIGKACGIARPYRYLIACITICWPYFILYALVPSSEILFTAFLVYATYHGLMSVQSKHTSSLIYTGLFFGLATLTRPVSLLLPVWLGIFVGMYIWYKHTNLIRPSIRKISFSLAIYIAVIIPWIGYISLKQGYIIPVASNLSYVFSKGNKTFAYLQQNELPSATTTSTQHTTSYLHKLITTKLKNVYLFWNPGAEGYHADLLAARVPYAQFMLTLYKIMFIGIVLSALWTIHTRRHPAVWYIWVTITYFWLLHTILFPFPRYTLPIIPFVLILSMLSLQKTLTPHT